MKNFEISTDSTCDLYANEIKEFGIYVGHLNFVVTKMGNMTDCEDNFQNEQQYVDFYEQLKNGATSKTSILNLQAHIDLFTKMAKNGVKNAIHISQGRGLSPTIDNAKQAIEIVKKDYPDINYVAIDSNTTTVGEGMLVKVAVEMRDKNATMQETVDKINSLKDKIQHLIIVDDLNFLKRGGRISSAAAVFGTMLQVKPIIEMSKEGLLKVVRKEKGMRRAIKSIVEEAKEKYTFNDVNKYVIVHTNNTEAATILQNLIKEELGVLPDIRIMGPIIGSHVGPNAVAFAFISNQERPF
ncbi:MAG: DegV family protein [Clostridia bacterium]|nr:DegV family protein [Clostridia bacterium]